MLWVQLSVSNDFAAARVPVAVALGGSIHPSCKATMHCRPASQRATISTKMRLGRVSLGNVTGIAVSSNTVLELPRVRNGARIVNSGRAVKRRDVPATRLVHAAGEAIARVSTGSTLTNHLVNSRGRARVLDAAVVVASAVAIMVLHEAWVTHPPVGSRGTNATVGFLHHDGEDEAVVNPRGIGGLLDGVVDGTNLFSAVVGLRGVLVAAGPQHLALVIVEHVRKRDPAAFGGPALSNTSVTPVHCIRVDAVASAVMDVAALVDGEVARADTLALLASLHAGRNWGFRSGTYSDWGMVSGHIVAAIRFLDCEN